MAIKSSGSLSFTEIYNEFPTGAQDSIKSNLSLLRFNIHTGIGLKFSDYYGKSNALEVLQFQTWYSAGGDTSYTWDQFWAPAGTKSFIIATAVNTHKSQDPFINSVTCDRALASDEFGNEVHVTPVYVTTPQAYYNSFIAIGCANFATPTTAAQTTIRFTTYPAFTTTHFFYEQGFMAIFLNKTITSRNPSDSGYGNGGFTYINDYKDGIVVAASVGKQNPDTSTNYSNFDQTSYRVPREPSYIFGYKLPSSNINDYQLWNPQPNINFAERGTIAAASWTPSQFG